MKEGPLAGQRFPVDGQLVLGRTDADVTIGDELVSQRHASVRPAGDVLEIEDLGSLNGTWVNGERISGVRRLVPGDLVALGGTIVEVAADEPHPRGTVLAPAPVPAGGRRSAAQVPSPAAPDDEMRTLTALFADIVGSTSLGERLPPGEVKALVGECVSRMSREVERFGGFIQAYAGDGIAAFFGVPLAHEDDAERAARAGLAILEVVGEYAAEVEAAWGIPNLTARVGINTGTVAVGLVGAAEPHSVMLGDATNVAARLQSAADPGTIAVGDTTAKALPHRFLRLPLGEIELKGRARPVTAWRLVSMQAGAEAAPATALVDREAESATLRAVLEELEQGRGQALVLLGDAGIGKTRLLTEFRLLAGHRVTWLEGQCLSYGAELVYDPFIRMLRTWLGVEEGEPELAVRTKLRAKLDLLVGGEIDELIPFLGRLLRLGLDPETDERLRMMPPDELAAAIRSAYRAWVAHLAERGPVVVALDDAHWADPSTRHLAEDLLELTDLSPVLCVAALRSDRASEGWLLRMRVLDDYSHRGRELALGPLSDGAAREFLRSLPRSRGLDASALGEIVAAAEGNPLYLEELVNASVDDAGRAETTALMVTQQTILTPTLESLLLARIDRLPSEARRLAQRAAVVGRRFPLRVLEQLDADFDLESALAALLRADIVRELRRYPDPEYTFRHGLLRQAALSTLSPSRRRALHGAVGAAFERVFADALDDRLEALAHYFVRSDEREKALDYLERAAERAAALDAGDRAAELWRRALELAESIGDRSSQDRLEQRISDGTPDS